ncbi:MAG TPA: hypothetical protein VKT28_03800 [Puia sp.]|nr:hypothetical protein [Puia sp.]
MVIAVVGTTFSKAIVQLDYNINQNYISSTLCENRNKPACCCRGKCFLKKQLQKDEGSDKNKSASTKDKFDINLFCELNNGNEQNAFIFKKNFSDNYLLKNLSSQLSSVFHPPGTTSGFSLI